MMPKSELHNRKKTKNYAVLAGIIALVALIFVVTILKMS